MSRTIGPFTVERETEIASSSVNGKTSQLLCAEIEDDCINHRVLIWLEVEGQEPEIIGRYSALTHRFIPAKETL